MSWPEMKTPFVGCGVVVEDIGLENIAVIERKYPPHGYAFPAGMMEIGETAEQCAIRETKEETNLDIEVRGLLTIISNPNFDPRWHAVSVYMVGQQIGDAEIQAEDDALKAFWMPWKSCDWEEKMTAATKLILSDYRKYRNNARFGQHSLGIIR